MAHKKSIFSRIRIVYRHSPLLLKCVLLAAIIFSTVALIALRVGIMDFHAQTNDLRNQAAQMEQENQELSEDIQNKDSVEGIKDIAGKELGLVDPTTVIFDVVEDNQN